MMSLALTWHTPSCWPLLALVTLGALGLAAASHRAARRRARALARPPTSWTQQLRAWVLPWAGACLLVVALMGPMMGTAAAATTWRGADIVVCLDVSRSMLASDTAPNRLEAAKADLARLAERATNDRLALVVFAGNARLVVPLTEDRASLNHMAKALTPADVGRGGTDLGAALTIAYGVLNDREVLLGQAPPAPGAIVLLTDGEDLAGKGLEAVRALRGTRGVSAVHCVGYGSERGSKIALRVEGADGPQDVYLTDRRGRDVVSAVDRPSLTRLAGATGGTFMAASDRADALQTLYGDALVPLAQEAVIQGAPTRTPNRFRWPLGLAVLLWLVAWHRGRGRHA